MTRHTLLQSSAGPIRAVAADLNAFDAAALVRAAPAR